MIKNIADAISWTVIGKVAAVLGILMAIVTFVGFLLAIRGFIAARRQALDRIKRTRTEIERREWR